MADEPAVFWPRPPVKRPRRVGVDCTLCGGAHASWWTTIQAPSCVERQERKTK